MVNESLFDFQLTAHRHKTAAIPGTVTSVPNYPKKLKIYLNNASPYWQTSFFDNGKTYRLSCKTNNKLEAFKKAIAFYEQLMLSKYQHPLHLKKRLVSPIKDLPLKADLRFKKIALLWLARQAKKWTPRHTLVVENRLTLNIFKHLGNKNIQKISRTDLLFILQKVEERGAHDTVRRLLNDFKKIWQFAMVLGLCKQDITIGMTSVLHAHVVVHHKAVGIDELPNLMQAISTYDKEGDRICAYALQLIALTFVRKSELTYAKWAEFDLDKAIWKVPAERMKKRIEHVVPLSKEALNLLLLLKKNYPSDNYVINNGKPNTPIPDNALMQALYWMGYKHKMTVHGFRAVASTILNEREFRVDVIERQLAHSEPNAVRRAYNRAEYMSERITMMNWWGEYLAKITPFNAV